MIIINLDHLAERDGKPDAKSWILAICADAIKQKRISRGWDGEAISGEGVYAFVNNGRWLARCKVCDTPMYVSPTTPVFYCSECGNGGSQSAWPVQFPENREDIEAALLEREVSVPTTRKARNQIEAALNSIPVIPGLGRDWRPGVTVDQLRLENRDANNN